MISSASSFNWLEPSSGPTSCSTASSPTTGKLNKKKLVEETVNERSNKKLVRPNVGAKMDELFMFWLTAPDTKHLICKLVGDEPVGNFPLFI